jgi:hypothetical protein
MAHKTRWKKREKRPSSCLHPKLSDKRGSILLHKVQNTKNQYQEWTPNSNSRTFTNRLKVLLLLYLFFSIINITITVFLSLFLPSSLSLLFFCYHPLFSLLTTLSAPSRQAPPPLFSFPSYPFSTCHHMTTPSYNITTHWLEYYSNHTQSQPPATMDISPSTTIAEIHSNIHKCHKTHQPP